MTLVFIAGLGIFPWLVMGPLGERFEGITPRLLVFALVVAGGAAILKGINPRGSWAACLLASALLNGFVYKLAAYIPEISTYPFSLGWSEASRFYYASLFFSERIYGVDVPPSVLHPTRYLLQAIPFITPNAPLWLHRAWQVFMWVATTLATGWLLARRIKLSVISYQSAVGGQRSAIGGQQPTVNRPPSTVHHPLSTDHCLLITLFSFLFLLQGPVYYHLLIMVILVLWGVDTRRFWRSLAVVLVASAWAGISRINWFPVPGMLAAALYFLEVSFQRSAVNRQPSTVNHLPSPVSRRLFSIVVYLLPPVVWTLAGTAIAFLSQQAYIVLSGNPAEQFGSSFTSDLLWYRLLPNPTYKMGVLPSIGLASLPLGLVFLAYLWRFWRSYHPIRLLGLASILGVLLAGGIVVSVKIGGGSNLHNLDAYLVLLLVVGVYVFFGRFTGDLPSIPLPAWEGAFAGRWVMAAAFLAIIPPLLFAVTPGGPYPLRNAAQAQSDLDSLRSTVTQSVQNGGEVLFIDQRHLLTYGYIPNVPLVADYELVFLTEMGMSDSAPYLARFHDDLAQHRFALIITHPLSIHFQGRSHEFGEENDSWVRQVSEPLLCDYAPVLNLPDVNVTVYAPRAESCR